MGKGLLSWLVGAGHSRTLGCPGRDMALLVMVGWTRETKNEEEVWCGCIPLLHQPGSDPKGQIGLLRSFQREAASWAALLQASALRLRLEGTFSYGSGGTLGRPSSPLSGLINSKQLEANICSSPRGSQALFHKSAEAAEEPARPSQASSESAQRANTSEAPASRHGLPVCRGGNLGHLQVQAPTVQAPTAPQRSQG